MIDLKLSQSASGEMLAKSGVDGTPLAEDFRTAALPPTQGSDRRVLLKGGTIISMDPAVGDFITGDLLIEGSKIAAVGANLEATATVVDASDTIVIPGLVDAHRHTWSSVFRRAIADADGGCYSHFADSLIPALREEDVYIASMLCDVSSLYSGITCMLDHNHLSKTPAITDAAIKGHFDSGLRVAYSYAPPRAGLSNPEHPGDVYRIKDRFFASEDQLVTLRLGTRLVSKNYALARELGLGITSDGVFGIKTPLRPNSSAERLLEMAAAGELGPDVTLIHGTGFSGPVMQAMEDHGVCIVLAPTSDSSLRGLGDSVPPIQGVIDHNMLDRTGISVDIEVALSSDLFAQMRGIFTIQRVLANRRWAAGDKDAPEPMMVRDVLRMATIGGARANGLIDRIGTLTPGKEADIVMIRTDNINVGPLNNAVGTVVIGAGVDSVDAVFVGGRLRKWNGQLLGFNTPAIVEAAKASRDYLAAETGLWTMADIIA